MQSPSPRHCLVYAFLLLYAILPALAWGQASFVTPFDTIPNVCQAVTKRAVRHGLWSQASTWSPAAVPTASDTVAIHNVTVQYDRTAGVAANVCIGTEGTLTFLPAVLTRLTVGTLFVQPGGTLEVGTTEHPVPATGRAELIFDCSAPLDAVKDPTQFACGLLVLDGELTMVSVPKTSFLRLSHEGAVGQTALTVATTPVGWHTGDTLVVADSRNLLSGGRVWETPSVTQLSGRSVGITPALTIPHPGSRDRIGAMEFTPHVGNLTRPILVRSKTPAGRRGHVWFSRRSLIDVQGVRFEDVGRTTTAPIGSTNLVGRYGPHFHHMIGRVPSPLSPYQGRFNNNVVMNTAAGNTHKWCITLHDTHYVQVRDNVLYNCAGAALMTEQGNEWRNTIHHNLALRGSGNGRRDGMGSEGGGFWLRGPGNDVQDNIATGFSSGYGYSLWQQYAGNIRVPNGPGSDTSVAGQYTTQSIYAIPLHRFEGNEVYGQSNGITAWWIGTDSVTMRATAESVVRDFTAWHIAKQVWVHYPAHRLVIDGLIIRGSRQAPTWVGFMGGDYVSSEVTIRNTDIQGVDVGVVVSTDTRGIQRLENTRIEAKTVGVRLATLWTSSAWVETKQGLHLLPPRRVEVSNTTILRMGTGGTFYRYTREFNPNPVRDLVQTDTLIVRQDQGVSGQNIQIYYREQAPMFVVPQDQRQADGRRMVWGAPVAGRTNAQTWSQYHLAIAGAVAPCATTRADIQGFVCAVGP